MPIWLSTESYIGIASIAEVGAGDQGMLSGETCSSAKSRRIGGVEFGRQSVVLTLADLLVDAGMDSCAP